MNSPRPTGSNPEALFHGETWDITRGPAAQLRNSSTVSWRKTRHGIYAVAKIPPSKAGKPGNPVKQFNVIQVFGDYVISAQGTRIAKPYKLRNSIKKEQIYGNTVNYSYPHNVAGDGLYGLYRTASIENSGSENQGIVPQFLLDDPIYAIQYNTGVYTEASDTTVPEGTSVDWLDLNIDGRAWARFSNQQF